MRGRSGDGSGKTKKPPAFLHRQVLATPSEGQHPRPRGIAAQFVLLGILAVFTGAMVGQERTLATLLAKNVFGVASAVAALSFLVTFGLAKALTNLGAGHLADLYGRKRILVLGWAIGIPVPILIIFAPAWWVVVLANALLGVNQGLAWSMALNMKIDLAGPKRRGLAAGINESLGYAGVALLALVAGLLAARYGIRPVPLLVCAGVAVAGLFLSIAASETHQPSASIRDDASRLGPALKRGLVRDPALASASLGGFATNLKDGIVWGLLPLLLAAQGASFPEIARVVALYPLVWAATQLGTGALSDRVGRKPLIVAGFVVQAGGLVFLAISPGAAMGAAVVLGLGTGLVYPTLIAHVSDAALPHERATSLGVYRFVRDLGYVGGALVGGLVADRFGIEAAFLAAGGIALGAGTMIAITRASTAHDRTARPVGAEEV